jgi:putative ABC transport system substrate-binding protein
MAGPEPVHPAARAFVQGLRALGYVEGQNLIVERRSAEWRVERFSDIVRELVHIKVDVIATNDRIAREARRVTSTVPIVVGISADRVGSGLVASLARPGGNITGLSGDAGPEIAANQLQLLKDAVSKITRVVFLASRFEWESLWGRSVRTAAPALAVTLLHVESVPKTTRTPSR